MTSRFKSSFLGRYLDWLVIGLVALGLRYSYWIVDGTRVVGDSTGYLRICNQGNFIEILSTHEVVYIGFTYPYCAFLGLPGGTIDGWIAIQIVLSAASCVVLYEIGRSLMNRYAGIVAGLALAVTYQGFHYINRPQTQVFFTVVFVGTLWALTKYLAEPSRKTRVLALGTMSYMAITRPNGVAYAVGFFLLDLLFRNPRHRLNLFFSRAVNLAVMGVLTVLGSMKLFLARDLFLPILFWKRRVIVTGHLRYPFELQESASNVLFVLLNIHHIVAMAVLRGVWFFIPILPGWSTPHVLVNLVTLAPLTLGGLLAIPHVIRHEKRIAKLCLPPLVMVLLIVMALWVPGPRKFLGPIIAVYGLLTGYLLTEHPYMEPLRSYLRDLRRTSFP